MLINPGQKSIRFKVDLDNDFYGKKFWSKVSSETYEPDTIKFLQHYCNGLTDFIDIGAANGAFSLIAFSLGARVYAFEPNPVIYEVAKRNFVLNSRKNKTLKIENKAVSSKSGKVVFKINADSSILSDIVFTGMNKDTVASISVVSLSELINDIHQNSKRKVVIKMDIEGAEWQILKSQSTLRVLRSHNAMLLLAVHPGFNRPFKKRIRGLDRINLVIFDLRNLADALKLFSDLSSVAKISRTNYNPVINKYKFAALVHGGYHEFLVDFSAKNR